MTKAILLTANVFAMEKGTFENHKFEFYMDHLYSRPSHPCFLIPGSVAFTLQNMLYQN